MRIANWVGIVALLFCLAGMPSPSGANEDYASLKQFSHVLDMVEKSYVKEVERKELIQGAIEGMLKNLDPHSAFLNKDAFQEMEVETQGEFTGVGIEITLREGRLTVVSPIEGTPAYEAGLKAGDTILKIDGEPTRDISIMDAVDKIRGPKGSEVDLTVLHEDENKPVTITVERDVIPMRSVKTQGLGSGYLYARISNFNQKTTDDLRKALNKQEKWKGIVLDLRNNPGGLLDQAVSVADMFLSRGKIVFTKGRVDQAQMSFSAEAQEEDIEASVVVLVNAGTASASEIVAGALQDQKRALVVGQQSFGKGSVQTIIPLQENTGIKLTTARYYTPNGNSIQAQGIIPDINVPYLPSDGKQGEEGSVLRERDLEGHLISQDEDTEGEVKKEKVLELLRGDNQLRVAYELVKSLPRIQEVH
ncbi:MAG: S41 family peptidase [Desulfohalobiaceae bacterium]|nr:S41 family peptidase [Desulfohalobiaceae bacterium]